MGPNKFLTPAEKYYPGEDYVDYIGTTMNNVPGYPKSFKRFLYRRGYDELKAFNKPIFFAEVGIMRDSDKERADYMDSVFNFLESYKVDCKGVMFFDFDVEERNGRAFKFTDAPEVVEVFKRRASEYLKNNPPYLNE